MMSRGYNYITVIDRFDGRSPSLQGLLWLVTILEMQSDECIANEENRRELHPRSAILPREIRD